MNHFEKSMYLYGVDLGLYLKREVKFVLKRIDLLEDNLKEVVRSSDTYKCDFKQCYEIEKAIKFWQDELKILRRKI